MGNKLNCNKRDENIDKIINRSDEINNDDFLNFDNNENSFIYNKDETTKINNNLSDEINDKINSEKNNEQIKENKDIDQYKIYNIKDLSRNQLLKLREIMDRFNDNGKPRSSDDFSANNYIKFYPKNEPYFNIDDTGIIHNQLKIYNYQDINNIKIYQGDLNKNEQRHGIGKLTTPYYVLIGMWKNDKFSGWGRESRCNGNVFEGRFEDGLINGKGIFLDSKKNKYIGDFVNMKRWGKGKWLTNTIFYEGEFYNNQMNGNGKIKFFKSGIEYIGTFKNDQIDGHGIFKWINGDKYKGEVKNGKMHGKGTYKYKNGKIINGIFNEGQIEEINTKNKLLNSKRKNLMESNTFDYKKKYRNLEMDSYTFDESNNYIQNYNLPLGHSHEGKKMAIYKTSPKKNLDVSYNKKMYREINTNKNNKNLFTSKTPTNSNISKNLAQTEFLEPIQENNEYIINDYNNENTKKPEVNELNQIKNGESKNNNDNIESLTNINEFRINENNNQHLNNFDNIYNNELFKGNNLGESNNYNLENILGNNQINYNEYNTNDIYEVNNDTNEQIDDITKYKIKDFDINKAYSYQFKKKPDNIVNNTMQDNNQNYIKSENNNYSFDYKKNINEIENINNNYDLNNQEKMNENEDIKEQSPNLLLSTYRNQGFNE